MDIDLARTDTPGCSNVLHFNNAGASLPPRPVIAALQGHLELEASVGGYEAADMASASLERGYDAVARLLGCSRDEVAFTESATRAWDMVFYALPFAPGDRILVGRAEYASNVIALLQVARRSGAQIVVIPDDEHGQISLSALAAAIDERTRLIALTHIPTNNGLVNPAAAVGALARAAGVPFLLDACQSAGQLPLSVEAIGCDMLAATGRKFLRGPRGTGFLYVRRAWIERLDPPFLDIHAAEWTGPMQYAVRADARRFEAWESNIAGRIALGVAIDYALLWGLDAIAARVTALATTLRTQLRALEGVAVHDSGQVQCGIVTFSRAGETAAQVQRRLRAGGMNVSLTTPSQARFDATARAHIALVRASVHYYNTEAEIERFCRLLSQP
jgi:selenocysteine lyase/cysteine desulfurase